MDNGSLKILIEKGVKPRRGIPGLVLSHFAEFTEARALGWSWSDIAEALGRPGEEKGFSTAFCKIKKRIDAGKLKLNPPAVGESAERKEVVPEKKKEAMPDAKAKTQKESVAFSSEDKAKGGRIGPPKPIGRGRLDLGENTPDDEL